MNVLNNSIHPPHCRACKERVREILVGIYGDCRANRAFAWPTRPEAYGDTAVGAALEDIRSALGDFRGHRDFIRSPQLPPCDFSVSDPPFILEFDESQHFSSARLITLNHYPNEIALGFPISRWRDLCREIDARDDEPFDRDERRAWYDTLRDLLPPLRGLGPTVRIYAGDFPWCQFAASSGAALARMQTILG